MTEDKSLSKSCTKIKEFFPNITFCVNVGSECEDCFVQKTKKKTLPKSLKFNLFQGCGATLEEVYGQEAMEMGRAVPLFGEGEYYTFIKREAARFGIVTKHQVILRNPFLLDNDLLWFQLLRDAKTPHLNNMNNLFYDEPEKVAGETIKLQKYLIKQDYDSLVVHLYGDLGTKRLTCMAEIDQVVKFKI